MMNRLLILPLLGLAGCAPGYWDPPAAAPISAAELNSALKKPSFSRSVPAEG
jgi:hypothetical protein